MVKTHFKAMDKPTLTTPSVTKHTKKIAKPIEYKPIVLIEDRPKKRATRKKVVKKNK
jgi:hypothetical protein